MSIEIGKLEIKGIIRRRKKIFIISFLLLFFTCLVVAFVLPPFYKAEATIVVENQEIPQDYVKSTITTFLSERLELLKKKILSYPKLLQIIKKYQLYPDMDSDGGMVAKMQKDIALQTIDVSLRDARSGGRGTATVAFTLSYYNRDPKKAKLVANTLADLFVEEDKQSREKQAAITTTFLEKQLAELRHQVALNEEKISRFKAENINQLPGSTGVFTQTIFRLEGEINNIDARIQSTQDKVVYLKSQIANIDPLVPIITENGKIASNPNNRLKYLRLKLIGMEAYFSDKYPDVIRLKKEIKELESQVGEVDTTSTEKKNRLFIVNKQLAELKAKYGEKYPDVIRLTREADLLRQQIAADPNSMTIDDEHSDNPGYMNIKAQLIVAQSQIKALQEEKEKVSKQLEGYQTRLDKMPYIEEEYNSLTLDYANAKKKFDEVSSKLHSARIAQQMDISQRGQRFHIDTPARLPDKPDKPNRILIVLMGFVLGAGGGVLLAALSEGLDSSVKVTDELESIARVPVLATVSFVDTPQQKRLRRLKQLKVAAAVLVAVLAASLIINRFVMPMGVLWDKFQHRLAEIGISVDKDGNNL